MEYNTKVYEIVDKEDNVLYVVLKHEDFISLGLGDIDLDYFCYQQLTKEEFIFDLKNNKL